MIVQDKFTYGQIESLGWQPMPSTFTPGESYGWAFGAWRMYPHIVATGKGGELVGLLLQRHEPAYNNAVVMIMLTYPNDVDDIKTLMRVLKIKQP